MSSISQPAVVPDGLLAYCRNSVHFGTPATWLATATGRSRLCGDHIDFYVVPSVNKADGHACHLQFSGHSCLVCRAVAGLICAHADHLGSTLLKEDLESGLAWLSHYADPQWEETPKNWEELAELRQYVTRIPCAIIAFETALTALASLREGLH